MKTLSKIILSVLILLGMLVGVFFGFRNNLLRNKVNERMEAYSQKHKVAISLGDISFSGLSSVELSKLALIPSSGDTLLWLGNARVSIELFPLLMGSTKVSDLQFHQLYLRPKEVAGKRNFDFLLRKDSTAQTDTKRGYAAVANRLIETLFNLLPANYKLSDFRVIGLRDSTKTSIIISRIESQAGNYDFWAGVYEPNNKSYWHFVGKTDRSARQLSGQITRKGNKGLFPVLKSTLDLSASVQQLDFSFTDNGITDDVLRLKSSLKVINLEVEHWRLSPKPVSIPVASADFDVNIGADFLEIDSASTVMLGTANILPYFKYVRRPDRTLALKVKMPKLPSQDFFDSFPAGLFSSVEGIKTSGDLSFFMNFAINLDHPEQVVYDADLKSDKFKIQKMGATNLGMMRDEFMHTAYEKGVAVKTFAVGPSNPNFVPLEKIGPLVQQAVLSSEDGSFFGHAGFNMETFQSSITENFRQKRFARGASTISMQLVKNVFLTRNKTLARKLEEILIVWLIENQRLTSKERMFEVYLNIIEWGPGIYGIGPASQFYFKKEPRNLTINESIYLSCIVPSPKYFRYRFDSEGHLKPELEHYFKVISGHLVSRGIIPEEIKNEMLFGVTLTGPALQLLKKPDAAIPDSTLLSEPHIFNQNWEE